MTVQHDDAADRARTATSPDLEQALVARLRALSADLAVTPDEEFRTATRRRLVAMAAVRAPAAEAAARRPPVRAGALHRLLAGGPDAPSARWRSRLTAGLAGAALTVTALGGVLAAAQGARPGDLLYDVKRGGEQTQLALASDDRRGDTLLDFASTRLHELGDLVGVDPNADAVVGTTPSGGEAGLASGPDVALVLGTLKTMDQQTTSGTAALTARAVEQSDAGALLGLTGWAAGQQAGLDKVAGAVPAGAQGALAGSRDLVGQVAARGAALKQALACPGGPSTAGADRLGPLPAACPVVPPATRGAPAPTDAPAPGVLPSDGTAATSAAAPATGTPGSPGAPAGPTPSVAVPVLPSGGATPTGRAPASSARRGLPLPSLPSLPGVPAQTTRPGTSSTPAAPSGTGGALVSLPPMVPKVSVCAPPLVTVGC